MDLLRSSARHDWETPADLFSALDAEFHFTLDVAASAQNAKCARYFDEAIDGLACDWGTSVCWMNPPYGREIAKWMRKALNASRRGATVVCLVPARTDTQWWHECAEAASERRFLRGRVRFLRGGVSIGDRSRGGATSPFPSAVIVFRASRSAPLGSPRSDIEDSVNG